MLAKVHPLTWVALALAAYVAVGGPSLGGCELGPLVPFSPAAPFKTTVPAVLFTHDSEPAARAALSTGQLDVLFSTGEGSVRDKVAKSGGQLRLLDKGQTDLQYEADWVRSAWAVKSPDVPAIVAASATAGVKPQKLPPDTSTEAVLKLLAPLGVK